MATVSKQAPQRDKYVIWAVMVGLVVIVAGFASGWMYFKGTAVHAAQAPIAVYSSIGPLVVRATGYSLKTTLALQTSEPDLKLIETNKVALKMALETALGSGNAEAMRAPDGLQALQATLKGVANATLKTGSVQDVLLTDFVLQSN